MDLPILLQVAGVIAAGAAGAAADKIIKAIRGDGKKESAPPPVIAQGLEDSIADVNSRLNKGFASLKRSMDDGFSRLDNAFANHRDELADLTRRVQRMERAADSTVRDLSDVEGRVKNLEEWRRAPSA